MSSIKLNLATKAILLFSIPLLFQISLFLVLLNEHRQAQQYVLSAQRCVKLSHDQLMLLCYLADIRTGNERQSIRYLGSEEFAQTRKNAMRKLEEITESLKDESTDALIMKTVKSHVDRSTKILTQRLGALSLMEYMRELNSIYNQFFFDSYELAKLVEARESMARTAMQELKSKAIRYQSMLWFGCFVQISAVLITAFVFRADILRRLSIMRENTLRLAMGRALNPQISGKDELSDLDSLFHKMADAVVDAAETESVLSENIRVVLCNIDGDSLAVTETNSAVADIFGYSSEDFIGMKLSNLITKEDRDHADESFAQCKTKAIAPFEARIRRKDGQLVDVLWTLRWSPADRVYFCAVHDNSLQKEAELERKRLLQLVTNDLKRPISDFASFVDQVRSRKAAELTERGETLANMASTAADQMLTLVNDLLDVENLRSGTLRVECTRVKISSLLQTVVEGTRAMADRMSVKVIAGETDLHAYIDQHRMLQVLSNLVTNAIKFSPKGSTVTLDVTASGDSVEISVTDKGRGIPANVLPHVFDRFKQSEVADAIEKKGLGLGLSITKALVELQSGTIQVESTQGEGSKFTVSVPQETTI